MKTRWSIAFDDDSTGAVDVFEESLDGLMILEADLGDVTRMHAFVPPSWSGPEITDIEAFTGGGLAGRSFDDLAEHLADARLTS